MFLVGLFSWWYGQGWLGQLRRMQDRLKATAAFFSIGQLFSTLFAPFRQISAGRVSGPVAIMLRAFFDRLISRIIGAIVRLFTILAGTVALICQTVYESVILFFWLLLPLFPLAGLIMMAIGWVPQ